MTRPCKRIVADYRRRFPHPVPLPNAGGWRTDHTSAALRHLTLTVHYAWWTAGTFHVWGFKDPADAEAFRAWAAASAIDWSVEPAEQPPEMRPEKPLEGPVHGQPAVSRINS